MNRRKQKSTSIIAEITAHHESGLETALEIMRLATEAEPMMENANSSGIFQPQT